MKTEIQYQTIVNIEYNSKTIFNEFLNLDGNWQTKEITLDKVEKIVYLGKCRFNGDLFCVYYNEPNVILIWKGIKGNEFNY
jgi:hypothetical protein